jgi:hypothetical protein
MAARPPLEPGAFWERLHEALGLQQHAAALAERGETEESAQCERRAMALLLEATCLLDEDEPALETVRSLATAGLARLRGLRPRGRADSRRRRVAVARVSAGATPMPLESSQE